MSKKNDWISPLPGLSLSFSVCSNFVSHFSWSWPNERWKHAPTEYNASHLPFFSYSFLSLRREEAIRRRCSYGWPSAESYHRSWSSI